MKYESATEEREFARATRGWLSGLTVLAFAVVLAVSGFSVAAPEPTNEDYVQATAAMDSRRWEEAASLFRKVADRGGDRADAALYWQARALFKLDRKDQALESLRNLERRFPESKWLDEARSLTDELNRSTRPGDRGSARESSDLQLQALLYLMQEDPAAARVRLEKFLVGPADERSKRNALFLLIQTGTSDAVAIGRDLALTSRSPDLRRSAVELLGVVGGKSSEQALEEIYRETMGRDREVAEKVLESFMISGNSERLAALANDEPDTRLRKKAIEMLGVMGNTAALDRLYTKESTEELREKILESFMVAGEEDRLMRIATTESVERLKTKAIEMLGVMGSNDRLKTLYSDNASNSVKESLMRASMIAGDADSLLDMAQRESSANLRGHAVQQLGVMGRSDLLWSLLEREQTPEVRSKIVEAFHLTGDFDRLEAVIRDPRFADVRRDAIKMLGLIGSPQAATALADLYREGSDSEKEAVLNALFLMNDADGLIAIARAERNLKLKQKAVEFLSLSGSPKAKAFMLELLDAN